MTFDPSKLRRLMEHQGRRHDWLAAQTAYSDAYVSRVLSGEVAMSAKFAERAAAALGVPVEFITNVAVAA